LICFCINFKLIENVKYRPVVLMHGLLASNEAMSHAEKWIKSDFEGIFVYNCEIGNGKKDSLEININTQVEIFASQVSNIKELKKWI